MINKETFKAASNANRLKYFDVIYEEVLNQAPKYGIDTPVKLIAFLANVSAETNGFIFAEELGSGAEYEGRSDLGNDQSGDGKKYKGRGFLQTTGRNNYNKISRKLTYDFINDPSQLAPSNTDLKKNIIDTDRLKNAILSAMIFWQKGGRSENGNTLSSKINPNTFGYGTFYSIYPWNDAKDGNEHNKVTSTFNLKTSIQYEKSGGKFLSDVIGQDRNSGFFNFELCCLNINGGYNGFRSRLDSFIKGLNALKNNDYKDNSANNNYDNADNTNNTINDSTQSDNQSNGNDKSAITNDIAYGGITNFFKSTMDLKPIEFSVEGTPDTSLYSDVGYTPFIWFNDIQISIVEFFTISCQNYLPILKLDFIDRYSTFNAKNFPLDNSKIKIFLNSGSTYLKPILLEFKVLKFVKDDLTYKIEGILNVDYALIQHFEVYENKSSFDCLIDFAKKSNLGFSSNINSTNDRMNWISVGYSGVQFMDKVVTHSYLSDEAFLAAYVDFSYNLVYIDIETQLKLNVSDELGIFNIPISDMGNRLSKDNNQNVTQIYLTNDVSHKDTNNYIEEYTVINNSTSTSIENGYISKVKYYDTNNKELLIFDIDSISSEGDNNIVMKGSTSDKYFFENNNTTKYQGKIDKDNMHKNYFYAEAQNSHNIKELEKIGMVIEMGSPNFNLYKFQKISVVITHQAPDFLTPMTNKRISGDWLIVDVEYKFIDNNMSQTVKLVRRDLGILDDEKIPEVKAPSNTENRGNKSIEEIETVPNNDIFEPSIAPNIDSIEVSTSNVMTVKYSGGDGSGYLVIIKEGSNIKTLPINDTLYTGDTIIGNGSKLGDGEYVIYSGSTKNITTVVGGIKPNTTYYINVFTYNSSGSNVKYLTDFYAENFYSTNNI